MNYITVYQMLKRAAEEGWEEFTIPSGASLSSIAKNRGTTTAALASKNKITNPNKIVAGGKILVPAKKAPAAPVQQPAPANTPTQPPQILYQGKPVTIYEGVPFEPRDAYNYKVVAGDAGQKIAGRNKVAWERLKNDPRNAKVNWDNLQIGQNIWVPVQNRQYIMESYGYDPETPWKWTDEASRRIALAESGDGEWLTNPASSARGYHHYLKGKFNAVKDRHKDLFGNWSHADLDNRDKSYLFNKTDINDFVRDWQYAGKGLMGDDMRPVFKYHKGGLGGMEDPESVKYAEDLATLY